VGMPELPEVETIKNQLSKKIKNKTIKNIKITDYKKNFHGRPGNILVKITNIQRRAKQLIFTLSNNFSFIIHLKLTGQLIYHKTLPQEIRKSTKVIFTFTDNSVLLFNDFRKFGFIKIIKTNEVEKYLSKNSTMPSNLSLNLPSNIKALLLMLPTVPLKTSQVVMNLMLKFTTGKIALNVKQN
jgi:formamidopyrimidine-DNA glycosylase